jgi:dethiobiotin synthetase
MTAMFVTATGTDIGKTFVACGMIAELRARGRDVDALKPIVTGFDAQTAHTSDTGRLLAALARAVTPNEIAQVSPFRLRAPLSPDMAARIEGASIDSRRSTPSAATPSAAAKTCSSSRASAASWFRSTSATRCSTG